MGRAIASYLLNCLAHSVSTDRTLSLKISSNVTSKLPSCDVHMCMHACKLVMSLTYKGDIYLH